VACEKGSIHEGGVFGMKVAGDENERSEQMEAIVKYMTIGKGCFA
jgi:hypothetical protein